MAERKEMRYELIPLFSQMFSEMRQPAVHPREPAIVRDPTAENRDRGTMEAIPDPTHHHEPATTDLRPATGCNYISTHNNH